MNSNNAAKNYGISNVNANGNFTNYNQKNYNTFQNKKNNTEGNNTGGNFKNFKQPFKKGDSRQSSNVNSTDKNLVPSSGVNQLNQVNQENSAPSSIIVDFPATLEIKENSNPEKIKKPRFKLDDKTLLYSENGVRKFYEIMQNTEFRDKASEAHNLNKFIMLFKNWHFMCFPKYDTELFIHKITDLGKKPPSRAYMSRLRKIYKGEESWDLLYNEQEQILTNPHLVKPGNIQSNAKNEISNNQANSPNAKIFKEDSNNLDKGSLSQTPTSQTNYNFNFNFNLNKTNLNNQLNKISDKLNTVEINSNGNGPNNLFGIKNNSLKIDNTNREDSDIQDLIFEDDIENIRDANQEEHPEINEKDYENFDHFYENNSIVSGTSSVYKREKRLFSEAFGKEDDAKSITGQSVISNFSHASKKTKKE